ncbi:MAG: 1,2-phenylacetyl-CoA epoxidase subunit B [Ignavibacteria bacterium]|nr:1,2-phenylacetyl-CoA epoxidase subunit B [Ignavibacteria bacterium]
MSIKSIDPRITRENLSEEPDQNPIKELNHWQTYEVFHQTKKGDHHIHVGSLHAPNAEMALILAKEQYARRYECVNIWVVKSANIFSSDYDDEDIFETTPEKMYREAGGYKVMEKINKYKKERKGV